jgi:hypothetical protein
MEDLVSRIGEKLEPVSASRYSDFNFNADKALDLSFAYRNLSRDIGEGKEHDLYICLSSYYGVIALAQPMGVNPQEQAVKDSNQAYYEATQSTDCEVILEKIADATKLLAEIIPEVKS